MATTFSSKLEKSIGTVPDTVCMALGTEVITVIGFSLANVSTLPVSCDAYISRAGDNFYLIKGVEIPVGSSLVVVGGEQKLVLISGDTLNVVSNQVASIDAIASIMITT